MRPRFALVFDRIMAASSGARANFKVVSGTSGNVAFLEPRVDPVERAVVLALGPSSPPLQPRTEYRLVVEDCLRPADRLAAFDGAAFVGRAVVRFTTGDDATGDVVTGDDPLDPAPVEACRAHDLLRARCGRCHGEDAPAMGLSLSTDRGVAATAIDRASRLVQQEVEPGGVGETARRFPYGLPIVARGSSSRSFLLFKVLMDPRRGEGRVAAELGALVPGASMPPPDEVRPGTVPLSIEELRVLRRWIDGGAPPCGVAGDAGATDAVASLPDASATDGLAPASDASVTDGVASDFDGGPFD